MRISAFYARVSTSGQEKEKTIDSQIEEIETKVKQDGNIIGQNLKFVDDGWSGMLLARPSLDELRDAIKNKAFEILYVYDLGRLSRNATNQFVLIDEIRNAGVKLVSLHDVNGDTDEGIMAQKIMGVFNDYERVKIAERMRRGKLYKAKNGILFGWQAPYGYKYIKGTVLNTGSFEIEEQEAKVIKMIFSWIGNEGLTIRRVIKRLYEQNITPRKSKKGYWSTSTLSKRLRDETYIGTTYYNKTLSMSPKNPRNLTKYKRIKKSSRVMKLKADWHAIKVPVIIEKDLFEKVQKQLVLNDMLAIRNKKNNYLLSNFIHCSCGCTRTGEGISNTQNLYYRCTDRVKRFPLPKVCNNKGVNAPLLDEIVWNKLTKLLTQPKLAKKYYEQWIREKQTIQNKPNTMQDVIKSKFNHLEAEEKRYLKAYGEGVISFEQYKEQANEIKLAKTQCMNKLSPSQSNQEQQKAVIIPDFDRMYDKMNTVLDKYSFDKRRIIVQNVVNNITTDGITATLEGYLPLEVEQVLTNKNVRSQIEYRYRWTSKRRQKYSFQCIIKKTGCKRSKLSFLHDRTKCWDNRSSR